MEAFVFATSVGTVSITAPNIEYAFQAVTAVQEILAASRDQFIQEHPEILGTDAAFDSMFEGKEGE